MLVFQVLQKTVLSPLWAFLLSWTRLWLGGLLVLCLFIWITERHKVFRLERIQLSMDKANSLYWQDQFKEVLSELQSYKGRTLWQLSLSQIRKMLERRGWVQDFRIMRHFPDELQIHLQPKRIVALLVLPNSQWGSPLTYEGDILSHAPLTRTPLVPIVREALYLNSWEARQKLLKFLTPLPQTAGAFNLQTIQEVQLHPKHAYFYLKKGQVVRLGAHNIPLQISRLHTVLRYLEEKKQFHQHIHADFLQKIIVKPPQ